MESALQQGGGGSEDGVSRALIVSYFYPPLNSTASDRAYYWHKYLGEFGVESFVITKNWNDKNTSDEFRNVERLNIEETKFKRIAKNKIFNKIYKQFSLIIDAIYLLDGEKAFISETIKYFNQNPATKVLITTSSPFSLLRVGYEIKQRLPGITWIADYRDDWSTNTLLYKNKFLTKYLYKPILSKIERKWMAKADAFTTVSDVYRDRISNLLQDKIPGHTIANGYDFLKEGTEVGLDHTVSWAYSGNIYKEQDFESLLGNLHECSSKYSSINTSVYFIGCNLTKARKHKLQAAAQDIKLIFLPRKDRRELDAFCSKMDGFIMTRYGDHKGVPSSKLYYYLSFTKPVFLFPSDNDIIDDTLSSVGVKINDLNRFYSAKSMDIPYTMNINHDQLQSYSRRNSTRKLARLIENISY